MNSNKIAKYFLVLEKYFLFVGETVDLSSLCLTEHRLEILEVQQVYVVEYAGIWKLRPNEG